MNDKLNGFNNGIDAFDGVGGMKPDHRMIFNSKKRKQKHLTNQKLWEMAKVIVSKQKETMISDSSKIDWNMLEDLWFDWLDDELFEEK